MFTGRTDEYLQGLRSKKVQLNAKVNFLLPTNWKRNRLLLLVPLRFGVPCPVMKQVNDKEWRNKRASCKVGAQV